MLYISYSNNTTHSSLTVVFEQHQPLNDWISEYSVVGNRLKNVVEMVDCHFCANFVSVGGWKQERSTDLAKYNTYTVWAAEVSTPLNALDC